MVTNNTNIKTNISIDPVTRLEGHLAIRLEIESNRIVNAYSSGEMFRGFENILRGRDPLDAQQITQRICGVCPISHGTASILAQEMAYGIDPPLNGVLMRNLILGANYIQSHIFHFYHLSALDFIDITAITQYQGNDTSLNDMKNWVKTQLSSKMLYPAAPFLPGYSGDYIKSKELNILAIKHYLDGLKMRALAQKMAAIFGGKLPHSPTLIPGGVTEKVTAIKISAYQSMLKELQKFINEAYLPDVIEVAKSFPQYFEIGKGCGNFLSYGVFPEPLNRNNTFLPEGVIIDGKNLSLDINKITEDVKYSLYSSGSGLKGANGETVPDPRKNGAYSWLKAPRYDKKVVEVGPLARMMVSYHKGEPASVKSLIDSTLNRLDKKPEDLISVMGRHAARALECKILADHYNEWLEQLRVDEPTSKDFDIPESCEGTGLTEAPRGALGHWIEIKERKIKNYQCIVPTTWNCSPRDDYDIPGVVEQALSGTLISDDKNPIEAARIVRSFDPCIACAVH